MIYARVVSIIPKALSIYFLSISAILFRTIPSSLLHSAGVIRYLLNIPLLHIPELQVQPSNREMPTDRNALLTAALSSTTFLARHYLPHAFFGGFATTLLGCQRPTKDIDILVHTTKQHLVSLLASSDHDRKIWLEVNQAREDYVAYLWKGLPDSIVLVEFFFLPQQAKLPPTYEHRHFGTSKLLPLLNPFHLFLGKLAAAAGRSKPTDLDDLVFLLGHFPRDIERGLRDLPLRSRSLHRWGIVKTDRKGRTEVLQLLGEVSRTSWEVRRAVIHAGLKVPASMKAGWSDEPVDRGRGRKMDQGEVQRGLVY